MHELAQAASARNAASLRETAPAELLALCDSRLDPLFWPSARTAVASAWYGHVPFAHWLVTATCPAAIVELGVHSGVSYSAFCEPVLRTGLATRCWAIDTWQGDAHAGRYGEEVFEEFRRFHDARYAAFSTLLRTTFDHAAGDFAVRSIDLLHIDGLHTYYAVKNDFDTWLPKLSSRGVILFHDIAERGKFEVYRLWRELRIRYPGFEFSHCHGLGVLAVGREAPAAVLALCRLDDVTAARVRSRFESLGEAYELRARWR